MKNNQAPQFFPNLVGKVHPDAEQAIRYLFSENYKPIPPGPKVPTLEEIKSSLQLGAPVPLNITGLPGVLAQPQLAQAPAIVNKPDSQNPLSQNNTLVSLNGLLYRFNANTEPGIWVPQQAIGAVLIDTHANRLANFPATDYVPGTLFFETNRTVFYIVKSISLTNTWVYAAGTMVSTSTTIADIPTDLGAHDYGFLFSNTYWAHQWVWLATSWQFAPGDSGSLYMVGALGVAPSGPFWGLCDGTTYTYMKPDATTGTIQSPTLQSGAFLRGGPYDGPGVNAAVRAKWEAGAVTDNAGAHNHSVFLSCGTTPLGTGSNFNYALCGFSVNTTTDGTHNHALTDSLAQLKVPSDANGGIPENMRLDWYIRL